MVKFQCPVCKTDQAMDDAVRVKERLVCYDCARICAIEIEKIRQIEEEQ
jgi:hypothetical protein